MGQKARPDPVVGPRCSDPVVLRINWNLTPNLESDPESRDPESRRISESLCLMSSESVTFARRTRLRLKHPYRVERKVYSIVPTHRPVT